MKRLICYKAHPFTGGASIATLLFVVLGLALPSSAALGGTLDSVQADQSQMKANLSTRHAAAYTIYELQAPNQLTVREYVSSEGRVFGVAWQGPFFPDMQQILGDYFAAYRTGVEEFKRANAGRRPLNIQQPGLVAQTAGHMRAYAGRMYDPDLVPSGVDVTVIH
jgi:hypothetical protein